MSTKKSFDVTNQATVTKMLMVEASSLEEAEELAHQDFSVECNGIAESYKQATVNSGLSRIWVVVDNAGTVDESNVEDFLTFDTANAFIKSRQEGQIMKRLSSGYLTTEY
jgi:hypothetical protein